MREMGRRGAQVWREREGGMGYEYGRREGGRGGGRYGNNLYILKVSYANEWIFTILRTNQHTVQAKHPQRIVGGWGIVIRLETKARPLQHSYM